MRGTEGPVGKRRLSGLPIIRLLRSKRRATSLLLVGERGGVEDMVYPPQGRVGGGDRRRAKAKLRTKTEAEPKGQAIRSSQKEVKSVLAVAVESGATSREVT